MPLKTVRKHNFSLSARAPKEQNTSKTSIGHVIGYHGNINFKKDCLNKSNAVAKSYS